MPTLNDLWQFDLPVGRDAFAKAAVACEEVWKKPVPAAGARPDAGIKFADTATALKERFDQFNRYLDGAMATPLDFFKILKWASEPAMPSRRTASAWANVWEELYLLAVALGRQRALSRWNHLPTQLATVPLKALAPPELKVVDASPAKVSRRRLFDPTATFVPGSKDWGFHPDDAALIYLPFIDRAAEARGRGPKQQLVLLRARLLMHHRNVAFFQQAQEVRRAATIYAMFRGLNLLSELELEILSGEVHNTDAFEAANRVWLEADRRYAIGEGEADFFAVVWIDPGSRYRGGRGAPSVCIEFDAFPGHIFKTFRRGDLVALANDQKFKLVAESLTALGAFLIVYLTVLGFVVDIITAGAASVTLRGLVFNFLKEKLIEGAVDKGLDIAHVNNKALRLAVQLVVGMKTAAAGRAVKSAEDVERALGNAMLVPPKVKLAALPHPSAGTVDINDHLSVIDPDLVHSVPDAIREQIRKASKLDFADEGGFEDWLNPLRDRLESAPVALETGVAGITTEGGRGLGNRMLRLGGTGGATGAGKGGASSISSKAAQTASARVTRFVNSGAYETLDLYKDFVPHIWDDLRKSRLAIVRNLRTDTRRDAMRLANDELRKLINAAKHASGEETALVDVFGRFAVDEVLAVPRRGTKGAEMLDVAVRLEPGQPYRFVLVEAKGNIRTGLGEVTRKKYAYAGERLFSVPHPSGGVVKQGSGEWYFQKFAEIYMDGQKRIPPNQAAMNMAVELMEAAKQAKIRFHVLKTSPALAKEFDDTAIVTNWFTQKVATAPKGALPIPQDLHR